MIVDPFDHRRSVLLAGSGRSGTTWVQETLNHRNAYRILFEPFHSERNPLLDGWRYRQYLPPESDDPRYLEAARAVLSGALRNEWADRFNRRFFVRRRLIKDIRISFLLGWMHRHFPEIPILLLVRHPVAVAFSKLKLKWETHLDELLEQEHLMADHLAPYERELRRARTPFERHVFLWCAESLVPLRQFGPGEILPVYYEDLCLRPEATWPKIFRWVGRPYSPRALERAGRASALARKGSAVRTGEDLVAGWQKQVDADQVARAAEICALFGLDRLYDGAYPALTGDEALELFPDAHVPTVGAP